jgi:hypothetical protein
MDITEVKWPARRRRGRYYNEFEREVVGSAHHSCDGPVSFGFTPHGFVPIVPSLRPVWQARDHQHRSTEHRPKFGYTACCHSRWLPMMRSSMCPALTTAAIVHGISTDHARRRGQRCTVLTQPASLFHRGISIQINRTISLVYDTPPC